MRLASVRLPFYADVRDVCMTMLISLFEDWRGDTECKSTRPFLFPHRVSSSSSAGEVPREGQAVGEADSRERLCGPHRPEVPHQVLGGEELQVNERERSALTHPT